MTLRPAAIVTSLLATVAALSVMAPPALSASDERALMACLQKNLSKADLAEVLKARDSGSDLGAVSPAVHATLQGCLLTNGTTVPKASPKPPKLTVSPMDPARVTSMSRFRSCAGHDYSGPTVSGPRETNRSMKNYIYVDAPWTDTGAITVRAPFAGTVHISEDSDTALGSWVRVVNSKGWAFTAFHSDPAVKEGQTIRAGAPLATFPPKNAAATIPDRMSEPEAIFDFTLESTDGRRALFVDYLTSKAAAPWKARGFTPAALTISKAERDAAPCSADYPDNPGSSGFVSAS